MKARFGTTAQTWIWQGAGLVAALAAGGIGYAAAGWRTPPAMAAGEAAVTAGAAAPGPGAPVHPNGNGTAAPPPESEMTPGTLRAGRRGFVDTGRLWESSALAGAGAAGAAGTGPEAWTIGGIYQTETGPSVIVTYSGSTPQRYLRVSEKLPNGATIVAIEPDSIIVRTLINKRWVLVAIDV